MSFNGIACLLGGLNIKMAFMRDGLEMACQPCSWFSLNVIEDALWSFSMRWSPAPMLSSVSPSLLLPRSELSKDIELSPESALILLMVRTRLFHTASLNVPLRLHLTGKACVVKHSDLSRQAKSSMP